MVPSVYILLIMHIFSFILPSVFIAMLGGCGMSVEEQSQKLALSKPTVESLSPHDRNTYLATYRTNKRKRSLTQVTSHTTQSPSLHISLSGGTAALPPTYHPQKFNPLSMNILGDHCEDALLHSSQSSHPATLSLCYLNDTLFVDASSTDSQYPVGSMIIPISSKVTGKQQFCGLSTQGNAKLNNVCLTITQPSESLHSNSVQAVTPSPKNKQFIAEPRRVIEVEAEHIE